MDSEAYVVLLILFHPASFFPCLDWTVHVSIVLLVAVSVCLITGQYRKYNYCLDLVHTKISSGPIYYLFIGHIGHAYRRAHFSIRLVWHAMQVECMQTS